jgi:hypothetical protein
MLNTMNVSPKLNFEDQTNMRDNSPLEQRLTILNLPMRGSDAFWITLESLIWKLKKKDIFNDIAQLH